MTDPRSNFLTSRALAALPGADPGQPACSTCAALACPGWESLPGGFSRSSLRCAGTLRNVDDEDPTLLEYHPNGTHAWSPDAPIALGYFPYNRCDVWQCVACRKPFLRYTEHGGYYSDERIREFDVGLLVDPAASF